MAEFSFLLPIFNAAAYLGETVDSLLAQTHTDFDIVVMDDGSVDESADIIAGYKDKRIRYYHQDNKGLVAALNAGLDLLDCKYVARIDGDDICFDNRLERQRDFLEFTGADATSCKVENIDPSGNLLGVSAPEWDFFAQDARFIPAREPYLPHPFLTARLDALKSVGGFRQAHLAEDTDICWRLFKNGRTGIQREVLGRYRVHPTSVSVTSKEAGRVQAFYSQLASLNSAREAEVNYKTTLIQAKAHADSFDNLISLYEDDLEREEIAHLKAASAMKFLDISNWRQLKLGQGDIDYAQKTLKAVNLSDENQWKIDQIFHAVKTRQPELFEKRGLFRR